jgi:hypothetical protein
MSVCLLFTHIFSIDVDFCFSSPVQRPRELLQSLGVPLWYMIYFRKSFPLKPLNQIKPNMAGMMLVWSESPAIHSGWRLVLKNNISLILAAATLL